MKSRKRIDARAVVVHAGQRDCRRATSQSRLGQFSSGNSGFVIPISFRYASPENWKSVRDLALPAELADGVLAGRRASSRPNDPVDLRPDGAPFGGHRDEERRVRQSASTRPRPKSGVVRRPAMIVRLRRNDLRQVVALVRDTDAVLLDERRRRTRASGRSAVVAACRAEAGLEDFAPAADGRHEMAGPARDIVEHGAETLLGAVSTSENSSRPSSNRSTSSARRGPRAVRRNRARVGCGLALRRAMRARPGEDGETSPKRNSRGHRSLPFVRLSDCSG